MSYFPDPEAPGSCVRRATEEDNEQLLELFSDIPMRGSLILTTERAPQFFSLYTLQDADTECWVYERAGRLLGLGTIISREGWVDGRSTRVAYLGDLRARPEVRGALARFYGQIFGDFQARTGCEHFYTGIMASNARALKSLTARGEHRKTQPRYDIFRRYDAIQVQFQRRPRVAASHLRVRTARPEDLSAITRFLADDHKNRPFGYRYDAGEFEHRLATWPGFSLDQTYLAFKNGALHGVCTAWDARDVKRYRVLAYRGQMRWVRWGYNAGSRLMRYTPLPQAGSCFNYFYLANLSVFERDPATLSAMLHRIYRDFWGQGYHFFMLYMEEADPLASATEPFSTRALPFHLYSVHAANAENKAYGANTSGFEIALA